MSERNKILVVDDDKEDQFILEQYFLDNNVGKDVVCFADNGQQAIRYLASVDDAESLPNLIVLDLNMPIMNGTQTLLHLKQDARLRKIPVIIFSTSNNEHERRKCFSLGAQDYLIKPITLEDGNKIVQKLIEYI